MWRGRSELNDLMLKKREEGYVMNEDSPERFTYGSGLDILC